MQIVPIYPTLIYHSNTDKLNFLQDNFKKVQNTLVQSNRLTRKRINEHLLSDITFSKNLVKEFELIEFQHEVLIHAIQYLQMIGRDTSTSNFEISESWMTVTTKHEHAPKHEHGSSDISGVFYVSTNGSDSVFYFSTPVKQCQSSKLFSASHPDMSISPVDGMFILFPGWLEHGVSTQTTDGERISISFNIKVTKNKEI